MLRRTVSTIESRYSYAMLLFLLLRPSPDPPKLTRVPAAAGNPSEYTRPRHRMSPERVHEIRQQFGGSATGMMYLQQTYAPPKL
eukprot:COSAG04_NODE_2255_length_4440_cov_25.402952_3_plen_84_part_00